MYHPYCFESVAHCLRIIPDFESQLRRSVRKDGIAFELAKMFDKYGLFESFDICDAYRHLQDDGACDPKSSLDNILKSLGESTSCENNYINRSVSYQDVMRLLDCKNGNLETYCHPGKIGETLTLFKGYFEYREWTNNKATLFSNMFLGLKKSSVSACECSGAKTVTQEFNVIPYEELSSSIQFDVCKSCGSPIVISGSVVYFSPVMILHVDRSRIEITDNNIIRKEDTSHVSFRNRLSFRVGSGTIDYSLTGIVCCTFQGYTAYTKLKDDWCRYTRRGITPLKANNVNSITSVATTAQLLFYTQI